MTRTVTALGLAGSLFVFFVVACSGNEDKEASLTEDVKPAAAVAVSEEAPAPQPAGGGAAVEVAASAGEPAAAVEQGTGISGIMVDPDGNPVPLGTIIYHKVKDEGGTEWGGQVATDSKGKFSIPEVKEGQYILQGRGVGFISPDVFNPKGEPVEAGTTDARVTVERGGQLSGTLVDPEGAPIPKANIVLQRSTEGGATAHAVLADDEGKFSFPGLAEGTYSLKATDGSLQDITESVEVEIVEGGVDPEIELRASRRP